MQLNSPPLFARKASIDLPGRGPLRHEGPQFCQLVESSLARRAQGASFQQGIDALDVFGGKRVPDLGFVEGAEEACGLVHLLPHLPGFPCQGVGEDLALLLLCRFPRVALGDGLFGCLRTSAARCRLSRMSRTGLQPMMRRATAA